MQRLKSTYFPKLAYDPEILRALYAESRHTLYHMAALSYLHRNPLVRWVVARRMRIVMDMLDLGEGRTLLDYGCGTGILFLQLPPRPDTYYGVDLEDWPAEKVLSHHRRDDVQLLKVSEWEAKIPDGSLDYLVALEVLEHVEDLPSIIKVFRKKLKPAGKLVVSGPTENFFYQVGRKIAGFKDEYHERDIKDVCAEILAEGFKEELKYALPLGGPFSAFLIYRYGLSKGGEQPG